MAAGIFFSSGVVVWPPGLQFVPEVRCRVLRGSVLGLAFWPSVSLNKTLILNFPVVLTLAILRGFPPPRKKRYA